MTASPALQAIYDRIPKVEGCRTACSDCCGCVPMIEEEVDAVPILIAKRPVARGEVYLTPIVGACSTCAYATPRGCSIYETRPFMCRLFAAVEGDPRLACPHGAKAANPLTADQARDLTIEYMSLSFKESQP